MNADVGCGARTASRQSFENDGRVEARQSRAPNIRLHINPPKAELGCFPHGFHRKDFLQKNVHTMTRVSKSIITYYYSLKIADVLFGIEILLSHPIVPCVVPFHWQRNQTPLSGIPFAHQWDLQKLQMKTKDLVSLRYNPVHSVMLCPQDKHIFDVTVLGYEKSTSCWVLVSLNNDHWCSFDKVELHNVDYLPLTACNLIFL